MATPTGGPAPSNGRGASDRPVLLASLAMGGLFVIVLAVSLLIGQQNAQPDSPELATAVAGDEGVGDRAAGDDVAGAMTAPAAGAATPAGDEPALGTFPGAAESAETSAVPTDASAGSPGLPMSAAPTATAAGGRPLVPAAGTTVRLETFRDPQGEFQLKIDRSWQAAETSGDDAPSPAANQDLTFVHADSGARLAISAWDTGTGIALDRWAMDLVPGLTSVDGRWPSNAMVAGEPAIVLWAPESPAVPAVYTVFFQHDGRVYRLAYAANDGGAALLDFVRLLVTLEWIAPDGSVGDTIDTIPPLPQPPSRYFPSAALLESGGSR